MKKLALFVLVIGLAGFSYYLGSTRNATPPGAAAPGGPAAAGGRGGGFPGGGFPGGGRGGRGGGRGTITVETAKAYRTSIAERITVVGNLVGQATVAVAPRIAGRLQDMYVRLGDRVGRGQRLAKIEDFEIVEQVKQAEAALEVSLATIRQRDADLRLAQTNVERSRSLFERQLLPKQTLDDNEARYLAAVAQLDLARAQNTQSRARLDELRINLTNTLIVSPVNGFVARRAVDPGAFVSTNTPVVDVVDISNVRLEANIVERDLRQLVAGNTTTVEVDAFPGETFEGRIARVSPVLDPATRTAPIEIEIPNPDFRLKPGMYARVGITTATHKDALVIPASALADLGGRRGVFVPLNDSAVFRSIQIGTEQRDVVEVLGGLTDGDTVITTGAGALRDGDRVLFAGRGGEGGGREGGGLTGRGREGASGEGFDPAARGQRGGPPPGAEGQTPDGPSGERRGAFTGRDGQFGGRGEFGEGGRRSGGEGRGRAGDGGGRFGGGRRGTAAPDAPSEP